MKGQVVDMDRRVFFQGLLGACAMGVLSTVARAGNLFSPKRGDPLRKELLDTIRARVESDVRQKVQFVVATINVLDNWAYLAVDPVDLKGNRIDIRKTKFAADADMMDGLTTYSLLRYKNGRWNEISFFTGPTDVSQLAWIDEYGISKKLMGF